MSRVAPADRTRREARLSRPRRIGILGHVGNGNLGDEAIIAAVLQSIRDRIPDAAVVGFTIRPDDTSARHGIPAYPLRPGAARRPKAPPPAPAMPGTPSVSSSVPALGSRPLSGFFRSVPGALPVLRLARRLLSGCQEVLAEAAFWPVRYRRLRKVDLLLVAGSNQLSDYVGGPWGFPYTVAAWSVAARLAGARVAFLSVGAGPVHSSASRRLLRIALRGSAFRSYRDVGSRDTVRSLGVPGPYRIEPDLAHGLRFDLPARRDVRPGGTRVVVNPLPYFDPRFWAEHDAAVYGRYVELLADLGATLLERGDEVAFVPTQLRADPPVITDVMRALERRRGISNPTGRLAPPVAGFEDLIEILADADVVIATRFHGVVLSQMVGTPVIGLAYRKSTTDLLVDVGQGAYALDASTVTLDEILDRLERLRADTGAKSRITRRLAEYRRALDTQYDELLGCRAITIPGAWGLE